MSLKLHLPPGSNIQVVGGDRQGDVVTFGDNVERITLGRDPAKCNVIFPESETKVGREHCAFKCELGRYQLVLNREDLVLVNGRPAVYSQDLDPPLAVQLGQGGPTLNVETELNPNLRPTEMRVRQAGQFTILREVGYKAEEALQRAKRGRVGAAAAVLLVGMVGAVSYFNADKQQGLTVEQKQRVDGLSVQLTAALQAQRQLQAMLVKAAASVYLVIDEDSEGNRSPRGTAWVLDQQKGYLATNAHMVEIFEQLNLNDDDKGHKLLVRSTGDNPRDFIIKSIMKHPGYQASGDLLADYVPYLQTSEIAGEAITPPTNFCDVGIYVLENPAGLAPALPLASLDTIKTLNPGYPLALIGFPMEGIFMGGVNVTAPTAVTQLGHIISLTNYFGASNVDFAERLLVRHSAPTAGGGSGSPILNHNGEVVAINNAENVLGTLNQVRVGSTAQINYAQRADLFNELTSGQLDAIQKARTAQWAKEIATYYQKKSDVLAQIQKGKDAEWAQRKTQLDNFFNDWRNSLPSGYSKDAGPGLLTSKDDKNEVQMVDTLLVECTKSEWNAYSYRTTLHVPGKGRLCLGTVGYLVDKTYLDVSNGADTDMNWNTDQVASGGVPLPPDGRLKRDTWMATLQFDVPGPGDYTLHALTDINAIYCQVRVEFAAAIPADNQPAAATPPATPSQPPPAASPSPPPTTADSVAAAWIAGKAEWRNWQAKPIWQGTVSVNNSTGGNWSATQSLPPCEAGEYLAIAHAGDNEVLALQISSGNPSPSSAPLPLADPWAQCPLSLTAKSDQVEISVVGPHQGVEVSLYLYQATKPAGIVP